MYRELPWDGVKQRGNPGFCVTRHRDPCSGRSIVPDKPAVEASEEDDMQNSMGGLYTRICIIKMSLVPGCHGDGWIPPVI